MFIIYYLFWAIRVWFTSSNWLKSAGKVNQKVMSTAPSAVVHPSRLNSFDIWNSLLKRYFPIKFIFQALELLLEWPVVLMIWELCLYHSGVWHVPEGHVCVPVWAWLDNLSWWKHQHIHRFSKRWQSTQKQNEGMKQQQTFVIRS